MTQQLTTSTQAHNQCISDLLTISLALRECPFSQTKHAEVGAAFNRISAMIQGQTVSGIVSAAHSPTRDTITDASQVTGLPAGLQRHE